MSFIGYGEAAGVDYAHVTVPIPGSPHPGSSFFTAAGVSYVMQSNSVHRRRARRARRPSSCRPTAATASRATSPSATAAAATPSTSSNAIKGLPVGSLHGCVTVGGAPAPQARVSRRPGDQRRHRQRHLDLRHRRRRLLRAARCRRAPTASPRRATACPTRAAARSPLVHPITIAAGDTVEQNIALPATGRVRVAVIDADGQPVPARIGVIGFDPSPEVVFPGGDTTGLFYDQTEALPFGYRPRRATPTRTATPSSTSSPAATSSSASRGVEYSLFDQPITVAAGAPVDVDGADRARRRHHRLRLLRLPRPRHRQRRLARARQRPRAPVRRRGRRQHHHDRPPRPHRPDADHRAPRLHARSCTPPIGEEITTWDYGHFNAYPLLMDPTLPERRLHRLGASRRRRARTSRRSAPTRLTPAELAGPGRHRAEQHARHDDPDQSHRQHLRPAADRHRAGAAAVVHQPGRQAALPPRPEQRQPVRPLQGARAVERLQPRQAVGVPRSAPRHLVQPSQPGPASPPPSATPTRTSSCRSTAPARAPGRRRRPTIPAEIDPADVARAVAAGRAVGGQGVYVQARLRAGDDSGAVADFTRDGSDDRAQRERHACCSTSSAQSPLWAPFDRIEIYANADTVVARARGGMPTLYGAEPTLVLTAGDDVPLEREVVDARVAGAERWVSHFTVPFPTRPATPGSSSSSRAPTASRGRCSRSSASDLAPRHQRHAGRPHRRQSRRGRHAGARLHQRALRRRRRRARLQPAAHAVIRIAAALGAGLLLAGAAVAQPSARGAPLLAAIESAPVTVLARVDAVQSVDISGYVATLTVLQPLRGAAAGAPLTVLWEELARGRPARLANGQTRPRRARRAAGRIAVAPALPPTTRARERSPATANAPASTIRRRATSQLLTRYAALPPDADAGAARVGAARHRRQRVAAARGRRARTIAPRAGAHRGDPGQGSRRPARDWPPTASARRRCASRSSARRRRRGGRRRGPRSSNWRDRAARSKPEALMAIAAVDGGLPPARAEALLDRPEAAVRAVGARFASGNAVERRLPALVRSDPDPRVRAAAAVALAATPHRLGRRRLRAGAGRSRSVGPLGRRGGARRARRAGGPHARRRRPHQPRRPPAAPSPPSRSPAPPASRPCAASASSCTDPKLRDFARSGRSGQAARNGGGLAHEP